MFESLSAAKPDAILALMAKFREDPRTNKIDLGVGVYKDGSGNTPVMGAIRKAEAMLHKSQTTKTYVGPAGDAGSIRRWLTWCLAKMHRKIAFVRHKRRVDRVHCGFWQSCCAGRGRMPPPGLSDPTWPNHVPLLGAAGLNLKQYPYFDAASGTVRFEDMIAALDAAKAGDILLLHGCCHNPTGANLTAAQWDRVTELVLEKDLFPFVDLAYQGFGDGLEQDAAGMRRMAAKVPEIGGCRQLFEKLRGLPGTHRNGICPRAQPG